MFVSAGFFLMRPARHPDTDVPAHVRFSLSGCISEFLPDTWCIGWADANNDPDAHRARFALGEADYGRLVEFVTSGFGKYFGWPNVVHDIGVATELFEWLGRSRGFDVVEVGLLDSDISDFVACAVPTASPPGIAPMGECGVLEKLRRNEPMSSTGVIVGFEPVSFCNGMGHSWRCTVEPELIGSTNAYGLIDDTGRARSVIRRLCNGTLAAEPEPYFAVCIRHIAGTSK